MILYNVTIKIDAEIAEEWMQWMQKVHIPDVMATGLFEAHRISRLLFQDESDGITYSIQYTLTDLQTLEKYQKEHAPRLQAEHTQRYKGRFVAFRTLMETVE